MPEAIASAETVYEIGSISKLFTAIAVLMLRDEGKLKLDDPLCAYVLVAYRGAAGFRHR